MWTVWTLWRRATLRFHPNAYGDVWLACLSCDGLYIPGNYRGTAYTALASLLWEMWRARGEISAHFRALRGR